MSADGAAPPPRQGRAVLPSFGFEDGAVLDGLEIAYSSWGELNAGRDNLLVLCPGASGGREWPTPYVRPGGAFDPERWFVVSVDLPGGGGSSRRRTRPDFPAAYTIGDLSRSVEALLDALDVPSARALCGPSMASLVGLDLACRSPDRVGALALWTGGVASDALAAANSEALTAILQLQPSEAAVRAAVAAFLPTLTGRARLAELGADRAALAATISKAWSELWAPEELVARYAMIGRCDLTRTYGEGLAALRRPTLFLQATNDLILPAENLRPLLEANANVRLEVVDTSWGHLATAAPPGSPEFDSFDRLTRAFLQELAS